MGALCITIDDTNIPMFEYCLEHYLKHSEFTNFGLEKIKSHMMVNGKSWFFNYFKSYASPDCHFGVSTNALRLGADYCYMLDRYFIPNIDQMINEFSLHHPLDEVWNTFLNQLRNQGYFYPGEYLAILVERIPVDYSKWGELITSLNDYPEAATQLLVRITNDDSFPNRKDWISALSSKNNCL